MNGVKLSFDTGCLFLDKVFFQLTRLEDLQNGPNRELESTMEDRLRTTIILLKDMLVKSDRDEIQSLGDTAQHCERISNVLQIISDNKLEVHISQNINPLSHLLTVGPLTRTEIPTDMLAKLISIGFNFNWTSKFMQLRLHAPTYFLPRISLIF